jgi:hypothetical protein
VLSGRAAAGRSPTKPHINNDLVLRCTIGTRLDLSVTAMPAGGDLARGAVFVQPDLN